MIIKPKKDLMPVKQPQLKKILSAIATQNKRKGYFEFTRIRNTTMLIMSATLGLRPKECYQAKLDHLDLEAKNFYIPSENNKERYADYIYIPDFLVNIFNVYLEYRVLYCKNSSWLFPTRSKHGHLDRSCYAKIFRNALKKTGLYKISYVDTQGLNRATLTPYSLRATFGNFVYEKTMDIKKTAIALRHRDSLMRTTWTYIRMREDLIRKEILKEIYKPSTPI